MFTTGTSPLSANHFVGIYGDNSAEDDTAQVMATGGHFTAFYCHSATTLGTHSMVFTFRRNGANTSLTCTIAAGATDGSTTGASIAFSAGDLVDVLEPGNPVAGGGFGSFAVAVGP